MKRSCTITLFAILMLCIISSPCTGETINPDSSTTNPIYQLVSVSTTPTPPTTSRNKYILAPFSLPPASLINQKESRTLVTGIFDKPTNKDEGKKNDVPTPECQGAIKQLGLFITSWNKGPHRRDHHFCWMLTEDCFYPHKKISCGPLSQCCYCMRYWQGVCMERQDSQFAMLRTVAIPQKICRQINCCCSCHFTLSTFPSDLGRDGGGL